MLYNVSWWHATAKVLNFEQKTETGLTKFKLDALLKRLSIMKGRARKIEVTIQKK